MEWFWFLIGCRVLYSYLYDDETLGIPHDEVVELERRLSLEAKNTPVHMANLKNFDSETYRGLVDRLFYFSQNNLPIS